MSTAMTQLNTRVPADLKRGGDAVFARAGLSASDVVRGVWRYAVETQSVPEFLVAEKKPSGEAATGALDGAGLAVAVAARECGFVDRGPSHLEGTCARDERDAMYDELLAQMDERCR